MRSGTAATMQMATRAQDVQAVEASTRRVPLEQAIEQFLGHLTAVRRRSPATVDAYRRDLQGFLAFVQPNGQQLRVDEISQADVYQWLASMQGAASATVCRRLSSLSAFFRTGSAVGYAMHNPVEQVERPRNRPKLMPAMGDEDVRKLLDAAKRPIQRAMVLTFATTGIRRSELTGIRVEDVGLERRRIRIRGKGGKEREVVISDELFAGLAARIYGGQLVPNSFLFPSRTGSRFHNSTLQRWFRRWVSTAALDGKGFTVHSFRRYAATRWLEHGLSVREIQVLLGHESLETTARYLNVELSRIQERIAELPAIGGEAEGGLATSAETVGKLSRFASGTE